MSEEDDAQFVRLALDEARVALSKGEVPVGAIVVRDVDRVVLGRGHNLRETTEDPTAHAEIVALRAASAQVGSWRLTGTTCYVTLEPCAMCAGALVSARVDRVVWGADDPKAGAIRSLYAIGVDGKLNHRFTTTPGVLAEECAGVLREFFAAQRALGKK